MSARLSARDLADVAHMTLTPGERRHLEGIKAAINEALRDKNPETACEQLEWAQAELKRITGRQWLRFFGRSGKQ